MLTVCIPKLRVILDFEDGNTKIPMILVKMAGEICLQDWSTTTHMKGNGFKMSLVYN